jgi:putative spermidine/putrescine transport system ATP-binding protein
MVVNWSIRTRHEEERAPAEGTNSQFVRFIDVQKSFDGATLVLADINLDVRKGEFLTFLGPSGSGKTTALMLLAGFEAPTSGDIFLDGRSLQSVPPNRRDIGMVFQSYALFPHKTIFDNLAFPLVARRKSKDDVKHRVAAALAMVHLEGYEHRRPNELSGGQQQRIALARALIFEPLLVLMDEPLSALDRKLREQMQLEIKRIHKQLGVTMIYVTHDQTEALVMSDRIAVFNRGKIEQLASPRDLYVEPTNAFVASFIGESNLLAGTIREIEGSICTVELDGGGIVRTLAVRAMGVGQRTTVAVRAECARINPAPLVPNRLEARIQEVIYVGDHTKLRVALLDGTSFFINVSGDDAGFRYTPNDLVTVGWAIKDGRALEPLASDDPQ